MYESHQATTNGQSHLTPLSLDSLISAFASHDPATCRHARQTLVRFGEDAVDALTKALEDRKAQVRWEAAKALVEIASPRAAAALVTALRDEECGVRWLAAEALIALGPDSIKPLLQGIVDHSGSPFLREGAHHVLRELVDGPLTDLVTPVVTALRGPAPEDRAPVEAYGALQRIRQRDWPMPVEASPRNARTP